MVDVTDYDTVWMKGGGMVEEMDVSAVDGEIPVPGAVEFFTEDPR